MGRRRLFPDSAVIVSGRGFSIVSVRPKMHLVEGFSAFGTGRDSGTRPQLAQVGASIQFLVSVVRHNFGEFPLIIWRVEAAIE